MNMVQKQAIEAGPLKCLEVRNLSYHYGSSGNGIDDISFTVEKDSFTVITGRIGSGKSTLLKTLTGLLPYEKGEIIWNDRSINNPADFFIAPVSAYTPQIPNLISESVKNNILFGLPEDTSGLEDAIHSAVLEQDIPELENGLDTVIGPKGVKLSGGQIQRVAAARMLIRDPQLMVFDDISSELDVETEIKLWARLFEKRSRACLVVSNRRAALKQADQILVMKDGRIYAKGRLEELLESCDEFQAIWG
jgi:ATP-binding cassette subfamily B protein